MEHFRVFLSSPCDVPDERTFAQQVIEQDLPKDPAFRGKITCEVVRYDDPVAPVGMVATESPQVTVDRRLPLPSQCDVVVVVLWSRLGSTLPGELYRKPDGSLYESGTERVFEEAINARPAGGRPAPHVLVYHRTSKVPFSADDKDFDEKTEQLRKLRQFLRRFDKEDGAFRHGLNTYESPQQFRDRLTNDLKAYIQERLDLLHASEEPASDKPPYREIARGLAEGNLLPFIGSGVLTGEHDPPALKYLPSSGELSRRLAEAAHLGVSADDQLTEVATYYEAKEGRPTLRARLHELFGPQATEQAAMPPLYTLLAKIKRPQLIITTNYDTLLERAFLNERTPYDLVVYPATDLKDMANAVLWWPHAEREPGEPLRPAPNELRVDPKTTTVIFKMHGSIQRDTDRWDGTVITEWDYVQLLARVSGESAIPSVLSAHIKDHSLLFLGFSLRDWSSRTILRRLRWHKAEEEDELPSWAVADHFTPMELMLWRKRAVYPIQVRLDEFARGLGEHLAP
ncbi:MAG: SIR2 family NAD-dependent protein deacylase [Caldimonas sp.]